MHCTIVGLAQHLDLEANTTGTVLRLRLPNGDVIEASVADDVSDKVVALSVQANGAPRPARSMPTVPAPPPIVPFAPIGANGKPPSIEDGTLPDLDTSDYATPPYHAAPSNGDETITVFGGEQDGPAQAAPPPIPVAAPVVLDPAKSQLTRNAKGELHMPQRTVPMDDHGYPIAQNGGVDPDSLTTSRNQDEDGVGSV